MTPTFPLIPTVLAACATMMASCAGYPPVSTAAPPRLTLPEAATRPCAVSVLPDAPTQADLEIAYIQRGGQVAACDGARRLAIETLIAEREMLDRWRAETRPRRGFRLW